MASNQMAAVTIFRKEDKELYEWYKSADLRVSRAQLGREAFECYRLLQELDRMRQDLHLTIQANSRGVFISIDEIDRVLIDAEKTSNFLEAILVLSEAVKRYCRKPPMP